jgi:hypothetical protein
VLSLFLIRLSCGLAISSTVLCRRDVVSPFFRTLSLVQLGLLTLGGLTLPDGWLPFGPALPWSLAAVCFVASVFWLLERRTIAAGLGWVATIGSVVATVLAGLTQAGLSASELPGLRAGLIVAGDFATAGTLGGFTAAMLLGHQYLTAPGMRLEPLYRGNSLLGGLILFRFLVSALSLAAQTQPEGSLHQTWLLLRWLAGIVIPAIFIVMVHRILKHRNTQSATGVLFAGVICAFLGELTADLLRADLKAAY